MLIKVKPSEGLTVAHPETGFPITGEVMIENSPAVIRLLNDGDLIEIKESFKKSKKAEAGE